LSLISLDTSQLTNPVTPAMIGPIGELAAIHKRIPALTNENISGTSSIILSGDLVCNLSKKFLILDGDLSCSALNLAISFSTSSEVAYVSSLNISLYTSNLNMLSGSGSFSVIALISDIIQSPFARVSN